MVEPTDLRVEPTDLGKSTKHHLQSRPNMIIKAWQNQGESTKNLITTLMQYRNMHSGQQTTEQPSDCQPTLRTIERLVWCTYQHGNPRDGILGNEIRSQDSKIIRRVLTEPTRTAARSCVRLLFDNGWSRRQPELPAITCLAADLRALSQSQPEHPRIHQV